MITSLVNGCNLHPPGTLQGVSSEIRFAVAMSHLDSCTEVLTELHEKCCEPGRSPAMTHLDRTLQNARNELNTNNQAFARRAIESLEDAGAQIGKLQVGCCAPSRIPLYAKFLEDLTLAQRVITADAELGH